MLSTYIHSRSVAHLTEAEGAIDISNAPWPRGEGGGVWRRYGPFISSGVKHVLAADKGCKRGWVLELSACEIRDWDEFGKIIQLYGFPQPLDFYVL